VLHESRPRKVVDLTERRYARPTVSKTFEGRDRFAPAAGWLAKGIELTAMGRPVSQWHVLEVPEPKASQQRLTGEVHHVDRCGNLESNIDRKRFEQFRQDGGVQIAIDGQVVAHLVTTYAEAPTGTVCALFGSTDHLEVALNGGSAAQSLGLGRGAQVRIDRS
jgi:S-adenosylmethionine hydrolase